MDIKLLEELYGFKILNYEKNKNVCKTETDKGMKCIKRAHLSSNYFLFVYTAVKHLAENGFNGVIPYNRTVDGRICVPDGKYIYYVTDWIESRESKFKRAEELKMVINTAANLHKSSIGYVPPSEAKPRVYYNKWIDKFNKKCIELLAFSKSIEEKDYVSEFDEIYAKHLSFYWHQGRESIDMIKKSAYEEISLKSKENGEFCHHDMANHNFLITSDNAVFIIDFDYCIMDTRLHDVASLVIRNMRYGVWDINKAYFILNEYSKCNSISDKELKVIKAFMTFPQDFWQIGLQFYVEKQPWSMDYFLMRLNRIVDDRDIRQNFLKEFVLL